MEPENAWQETGYTGKYNIGKPPAQPTQKCRIEISGKELNYAWSVAEDLINRGMAKFVRWV